MKNGKGDGAILSRSNGGGQSRPCPTAAPAFVPLRQKRLPRFSGPRWRKRFRADRAVGAPHRVDLPTFRDLTHAKATALAAHIVERVSGLSWQEYEERYILGPLGMRHTTGRQVLPDALRPDMSNGYRFVDGRFELEPFEHLAGLAPAGAIAASAVDIATFMLAHLGDGAINGQRILRIDTAELMHRRTFSHDPRLPGFALGFYEQSSHGLRIIGHGGNTQWFHTNLTLIPSEHVGVFVSYNTDTGHVLSIGPFLREFLNHYYPTTPAPVAVDADARIRARQIAGEYRFNRMSYTTFQRAVGLASPTTVAANGGGTLEMTSPLGVMHLLPVEPWLYRDEQGDDLVAFKADASGAVTRGFVGSMPMMAMERVPWYQSARLHRIVLGIAGAVFILTIWASIGRAVRRSLHYPRPTDNASGRALIAWAAAADLAFLVAAALLAADATANAGAVLTNSSIPIDLVLGLPVIAAVLASIAAVVSIKQWMAHVGMPASRLRYAAVVVVTFLFTWSLNEWNLFGWKL